MVEQKSDGSLVYVEQTAQTNKVWGIVRKNMEVQFSEPYTFISRPLRYKDSIVSRSKRSYEAYGGYEGSGTTKTIADGWGTLKLPSGTCKVLRVRFEQSFDDVSKANGSILKNTVTTYAWFDKDHAGALFKISTVSINSDAYNNEFKTAELLISEHRPK